MSLYLYMTPWVPGFSVTAPIRRSIQWTFSKITLFQFSSENQLNAQDTVALIPGKLILLYDIRMPLHKNMERVRIKR